LHFENAVLFGNCAAVDAVKKDAEETFAVSKQIGKADMRKSAIGRLFDSLLRLFETMF
jgi:cardiolipin synthase